MAEQLSDEQITEALAAFKNDIMQEFHARIDAIVRGQNENDRAAAARVHAAVDLISGLMKRIDELEGRTSTRPA